MARMSGFSLALATTLLLPLSNPLTLDEWRVRSKITGAASIGHPTPGGGVRGLVAEVDLAPGDEALRVPLEMAFVEPDQHESGTHWTGRLARRVALACEQGNEHPAAPYLAALPPPPPALFTWPSPLQDQVQNRSLQADADGLWFWRQDQWFDQQDLHPDEPVEEVAFLRALDLVCSRTIRVDDKLLLVPVLDMANHAVAEGGGGYFELDSSDNAVCLMAGPRGVKQGQEVYLNYGDRCVEDFVLHYGFVPDRAPSDSVFVPNVGTVAWSTCATLSSEARELCAAFLATFPTSIAEDVDLLENAADAEDGTHESMLRVALQYRLAKKRLVAAAAGIPASGPGSSVFR